MKIYASRGRYFALKSEAKAYAKERAFHSSYDAAVNEYECSRPTKHLMVRALNGSDWYMTETTIGYWEIEDDGVTIEWREVRR